MLFGEFLEAPLEVAGRAVQPVRQLCVVRNRTGIQQRANQLIVETPVSMFAVPCRFAFVGLRRWVQALALLASRLELVLGHRSSSPVSLIYKAHVRYLLQPGEIPLQLSKFGVRRIAYERCDTNVVSVTSLELL
jgi:hypothetical protein